MASQRGRDLLLKIGDGASPEQFQTVAGIRAKTIALSAKSVDATSAESPSQWRELLAGAGPKQANVNGAGIFKDAASDALMRELFFAQSARNWRLILPDFGVLEGPFLIEQLDYGGDHDGEATFAIRLQSAGALGFVAL
jgi:TP901-1 family phage major tail protein